jgi:hypothetical protein
VKKGSSCFIILMIIIIANWNSVSITAAMVLVLYTKPLSIYADTRQGQIPTLSQAILVIFPKFILCNFIFIIHPSPLMNYLVTLQMGLSKLCHYFMSCDHSHLTYLLLQLYLIFNQLFFFHRPMFSCTILLAVL